VNTVVVSLANSIVSANLIVQLFTVAVYSLSPTYNLAFLIVLEFTVQEAGVLQVATNSNLFIFTPSVEFVFTLNEIASTFSAHFAKSSFDNFTLVIFKAESAQFISIHELGFEISVTRVSFSSSVILKLSA
jgi:hypothetical protein